MGGDMLCAQGTQGTSFKMLLFVVLAAAAVAAGAPVGLPAIPAPGWTATITGNFSAVGAAAHPANPGHRSLFNHTIVRIEQQLHFDTAKRRLRIDYSYYPGSVPSVPIPSVPNTTVVAEYCNATGKLNVTLLRAGCGVMWKLVPVSFPTTVDELVWFGGFAEHGLGSALSYGYQRAELEPYPFLGPCNADSRLNNYSTPHGTVGVWRWDSNVGNFGITLSRYEVYVDGPLAGLPVATSFTDDIRSASDTWFGATAGSAVFSRHSLGAVPASLFSAASLQHC